MRTGILMLKPLASTASTLPLAPQFEPYALPAVLALLAGPHRSCCLQGV